MLKEERKRHDELIGQVDYFQQEMRVREETNFKLEESLRTINRVVDEQQKRFEEERNAHYSLREGLKDLQKNSDETTKE